MNSEKLDERALKQFKETHDDIEAVKKEFRLSYIEATLLVSVSTQTLLAKILTLQLQRIEQCIK